MSLKPAKQKLTFAEKVYLRKALESIKDVWVSYQWGSSRDYMLSMAISCLEDILELERIKK